MLRKKKPGVPLLVHPESVGWQLQEIPSYNKIAVALDFSESDEKILVHAIGQGKKGTTYILIHVVESVSAQFLGKDSDDFETRADKERLQSYIKRLELQGYSSVGALGYHNRTKEIVRLVEESEASLLVIGAHGHSGVKDWIYGETINSVRHELKIPVLVVNL